MQRRDFLRYMISAPPKAGRISKWTMRVRGWSTIIGQISIHLGDRMEIPV